MHPFYKLWAEELGKELGFELRDGAIYRGDEKLYTVDSDENFQGYLKGAEIVLPAEKREAIHKLLGQLQQEEHAYHLIWGTAAYILPDGKEFWSIIKLARAWQKRTGAPDVNLEHTYLLYMGNKWSVILNVVTDEPSEIVFDMLDALDAQMRPKGCPILGDDKRLHPEFLGTAVALRKNPKFADCYTPEIVEKLDMLMSATLGAVGMKCVNCKLVPAPEAMEMEKEKVENGYMMC